MTSYPQNIIPKDSIIKQLTGGGGSCETGLSEVWTVLTGWRRTADSVDIWVSVSSSPCYGLDILTVITEQRRPGNGKWSDGIRLLLLPTPGLSMLGGRISDTATGGIEIR